MKDMRNADNAAVVSDADAQTSGRTVHISKKHTLFVIFFVVCLFQPNFKGLKSPIRSQTEQFCQFSCKNHLQINHFSSAKARK